MIVQEKNIVRKRFLFGKGSGKQNHPAKYALAEKEARNSGKAYHRKALKNRKEKEVEAKVGTRVICKCKRKCFRKFSNADCVNLCKDFYQSGKLEDRRRFLAQFIVAHKVPLKRDNFTYRSRYQYQLPSFYSLPQYQSVGKIEVCRLFFTNALSTTKRFIHWTLEKKIKKGWLVEGDKRGGVRMVSITPEGSFNEVCQHVRSISSLPSHYTRKGNDTIKYIDGFTTVRSLFNSYLNEKLQTMNAFAQHRVDNIPVDLPPKVSYYVYHAIFRTYFPNIRTRRPLRDKCKSCLRFNSLDTQYLYRNPVLAEEHAHHIVRKDVARMEKLNDKILAAYPNSKFQCVFFDMQKNLETPCCKYDFL